MYAFTAITGIADKGPKAIISFSPTEIDGPTMAMFDGSGSYADHRGEHRGSIISYYWSFSDGTTNSSDVVQKVITQDMPSPTAEFTVSDGHCTHTTNSTVEGRLPEKPPEVPLLSPVGLLALVGLICIAGGRS